MYKIGLILNFIACLFFAIPTGIYGVIFLFVAPFFAWLHMDMIHKITKHTKNSSLYLIWAFWIVIFAFKLFFVDYGKNGILSEYYGAHFTSFVSGVISAGSFLMYVILYGYAMYFNDSSPSK